MASADSLRKSDTHQVLKGANNKQHFPKKWKNTYKSEKLMKKTTKISMLLALGLSASSAVALPEPDKFTVCESNPKYVWSHWNSLDDVYRKYSQNYVVNATGLTSQIISAYEYRMNCPLSAADKPVVGPINPNPGVVVGEDAGDSPEMRLRGKAVRSDIFDPGSLNPGLQPQPKPSNSRLSADPKLEKRE